MIEAARERAIEPDFYVEPDNWDAVQMFLKMQTQWVVGMSGVIGLNYQSLEFLFKIENIADPKKMLDEIRVIEIGVLNCLAEDKRGST